MNRADLLRKLAELKIPHNEKTLKPTVQETAVMAALIAKIEAKPSLAHVPLASLKVRNDAV